MGMRPPYSEYAPPPIYIYPARTGPRPGVHFSRTELFQLFVAILLLSLALTLAQVSPFTGGARFANSSGIIGLFFVAALVAVATGVGLHEIAHKVIAQRYGNWAEFRYNLRGLGIAFMFAVFGLIIAAPGATLVSGVVSRQQNGRISAAGPVSNILVAVVFLIASATIMRGVASFDLLLLLARFIFVSTWQINLILAGFNMIPILPFDGAKVWGWNKVAWVGIVATVVLLYVIGVAFDLART
jgi:Zn-dependent protease